MQTAPTTPATDVQVELDLDARLALVGAVMDERCKLAVLAIGVNTAHIPDADPIPEVTAPIPLTPTTAPCPYTTPIAVTLHKAQLRLADGGWCTGALRDEQGAACLIGAIRAEAGGRSEADDACVLLLEAIRRDFPNAETIPSWNDARNSPRQPLLYLDRAAALAHARTL
ncbi:DUF6197 family protein [Streptomyces scabiei]|uniref:DUF6197 family protein n=1 Tax=Streptomyces scabiei TaxID=1930 RepID=UPI000765F5D0|nr:hypothetical protein [Streptomyces scabiei]